MIRELRRRHRSLIGLLSVLVPGVFVAAIAGRRPPIVMTTLPATLTGRMAGPQTATRQGEIGLPPLRVSVTLVVDPAATGLTTVVLRPESSALPPDLLVYWSPAASSDSSLPAAAELLGVLDGEAAVGLPLPPAAREGGGVLLLYSGADRRVAASGPLPGSDLPPARP